MEQMQLYNGDCGEIMREFDDDAIDLTVTSPPYDNLRDYHGYSFDFEAVAGNLYRITKHGGGSGVDCLRRRGGWQRNRNIFQTGVGLYACWVQTARHHDMA